MLSTEKIFNIAANSYDKTEEVEFRDYTDITIDNIKKYLKSIDLILDFGCATGTKALTLADSVDKIIAIDISSKMIELAKIKANDLKNGNVNFIRTTIFDESFTKNSFDAVVACNVLHLIKNDFEAVGRVSDLLKPGGLFISTTPCLKEKMNLKHYLKFFPIRILMKLGLFMPLQEYKFADLKNLINHKSMEIIEDKQYLYGLSSYFIVAKKKV